MTVIALLGFWIAFVPVAQAGHKPPGITFRVHVQTGGQGQSPMSAVPVTLPDGEEIVVRAQPELTELEMRAVTLRPDGSIAIQFDHTGRVDLNIFTLQDQGRMMVVLINGAIVYAPLIDAQITNGILILPHPLPLEVVALLKQTADANAKEAQGKDVRDS